MVTKTVEALRKLGRGARGVEDSVGYSLGHRIRCEILAALHEGPESAAGLAKIVKQRLSTVTHHIEELLKDGSIDIARTEKVRGNISQHYYYVVELPEFSEEEIAAMSPEDRQVLAALIVQASASEAMASLWVGKLRDDPRVSLIWNRIPMDKKGREDLADLILRTWRQVKEIEAESTDRRIESGEPGVMCVVTLFAYERARSAAPPPLASGEA